MPADPQGLYWRPMRAGKTAIILIVIALAGVALALWFKGRAPTPPAPEPHQAADDAERRHHADASSSTSRPREAGSRRSGLGGTGDIEDAGGARARDGVTVDVIGAGGSAPHGSGGDGEGDEGGADEAETMAELGARMGIDTSMDDDWTLEDEAGQWFAPVEEAFRASRPLDPDRYKDVLQDYEETTTQVLRRSAEIADELGPDRGIAFIESYNDLVEGYRNEAYGTP